MEKMNLNFVLLIGLQFTAYVSFAQSPTVTTPKSVSEANLNTGNDLNSLLKRSASGELVVVPVDIKRMGEESLPLDLNLQGETKAVISNATERMKEAVQSGDAYGKRLLLFELAPQEKIYLKLLGDSGSSVVMILVAKKSNEPFLKEINNINKYSPYRGRVINFKNSSASSYSLVVKVAGLSREAYDLSITRSL